MNTIQEVNLFQEAKDYLLKITTDYLASAHIQDKRYFDDKNMNCSCFTKKKMTSELILKYLEQSDFHKVDLVIAAANFIVNAMNQDEKEVLKKL